MPQMMPMYWLMMMITIMMLLLIIINFIHFLLILPLPSTSNKFNSIKSLWIWKW